MFIHDDLLFNFYQTAFAYILTKFNLVFNSFFIMTLILSWKLSILEWSLREDFAIKDFVFRDLLPYQEANQNGDNLV